MSHVAEYLQEVQQIAKEISHADIESLAVALSQVKGKVYVIGLGGSLANAIHMAADLRKLCQIDALAPNISEMTANMNDQGLSAAFDTPGSTGDDVLFVLSVGGGTNEVSTAITKKVERASMSGIPIYGIVGPNGGITAEKGTIVIKVPVLNSKHVTPHTEAFQAVIWHCLVSHPILQKRPTKW
jgi:D-sedoheptulose 7-phosphate isomerase